MHGDDDASLQIFETSRPRLRGLAYRMLGSVADAEDAVQDTYLRWQSAAGRGIESPEAWLTTACTRRCIDMLRAAHRARVDYVGPWLPEPLIAATQPDQVDPVELASSLSTAFLLLLERLTPTERAAYLLHDIFDYDYADIAAVLNKGQPACRKLVSRARKHVSAATARFDPNPERQRHLLDGFLEALKTGAIGRLESLLAEDVQVWADSGGKALAFGDVVRGAEAAAALLDMIWRNAWSRYDLVSADVAGAPGFLLRESGALVAAVSLTLDPDGRIAGLYVMRNPDKLVAGATVTRLQ